MAGHFRTLIAGHRQSTSARSVISISLWRHQEHHSYRADRLSQRCGVVSPKISYRIISLYNVTHNRLIKLLELIGFAAIGGTIYSFLGMVDSPYRWYVFGACAGVAMAVIWYRKRLRDRMEKV